MPAAALQAGGCRQQPQALRFTSLLGHPRLTWLQLAAALAATPEMRQARPADGEGARLVKRHRCDLVGEFQCLRVLDQDAVLGRHPGAGHDRGRRGQAERAGAGDHHHRHSMDHGLLKRMP